jgi:predicted thioesterase
LSATADLVVSEDDTALALATGDVPVLATPRVVRLAEIEGRRLTFRVSVSDGHGLVAAGRITRVIVERARFLEKAAGA